MVEINQTAASYLLSSSALASISTISFFKGVNYFFSSLQKKTEKVDEEEAFAKTRMQALFSGCAWMGLATLSGYFCVHFTNEFLDVHPFLYDTGDIQSFREEQHDFKNLAMHFFNERISLRNFCLNILQSADAYQILVQGSRPSYEGDPQVRIAQYAIQSIERIQREYRALEEELQERIDRYAHHFEQLKSALKEKEVARGIKVDFNFLCKTPFQILSPKICPDYHQHQNLLQRYFQMQAEIKDYLEGIVHKDLYRRCREIYPIEVDGIPTYLAIKNSTKPTPYLPIRIWRSLKDFFNNSLKALAG